MKCWFLFPWWDNALKDLLGPMTYLYDRRLAVWILQFNDDTGLSQAFDCGCVAVWLPAFQSGIVLAHYRLLVVAGLRLVVTSTLESLP